MSNWTSLSPNDVAAFFAEKRHGWKPTPLSCAGIGGQLDWLFRTVLKEGYPTSASGDYPKWELMEVEKHGRALSRELLKWKRNITARYIFHETYCHKEIGADPGRDLVKFLEDFERELETVVTLAASPSVGNPKAGRQTDAWRFAAKATYEIINDAARREGRAVDFALNSESQIAGVIVKILSRAGYGQRTPSAVAAACADHRQQPATIITHALNV